MKVQSLKAEVERNERRELGRVLKQTIDVYRTTGTRGTADQALTDRVATSAEDALTAWLGEALVGEGQRPKAKVENTEVAS